jgi:hypothetical protein
MRKYLDQIKEWYLAHERHISSFALLFGFVVDSITLQRIDLLFENVVLFTHLTIVGVGIILINMFEANKLRGNIGNFIMSVAPVVVQFSFGALFSGFFIFYTRSAALVTSWPFVLFLLALLIGNEMLRERYLRFGYQITVYYITIFSFAIFYVPIILGSIGPGTFIVSGVVSVLLISLYVYALYMIIPWRVVRARKSLPVIIGGIYVLMHVLYFTNIIPPIPLSLKDAGVYHSIVRSGDTYHAQTESYPWYDIGHYILPTYKIAHGEGAYFFSAVFSPTDLDTSIVHSWQYYDEKDEEWIESFTFEYSIVGGRDGGYRGYTVKENLFEGKWRVDVETPRGQLLGRHVFMVEQVQESPVLVEITL